MGSYMNFNLDVQKSAVTYTSFFNSVTTSCTVKQTVPRNIDKDGRMFCGEF